MEAYVMIPAKTGISYVAGVVRMTFVRTAQPRRSCDYSQRADTVELISAGVDVVARARTYQDSGMSAR